MENQPASANPEESKSSIFTSRVPNIKIPNSTSGKLAANHLGIECIKPFENIALAFSGGGFRAATFALGVLAYLNNVHFDDDTDEMKGHSLLQQVTYMSSASGGTITAASYALANAQGKTFGEFYVKLLDNLTGEQVLLHALEILSDKNRWNKRPEKARNIINAFAMAYDEYIFDGEILQTLYYKNGITGHLQEVCFNTTEFYTGQSFRQDKKMVADRKPDNFYKYGNEVIHLDHVVAGQLKLADLLASSSCFPAGFEPIVFPNDFTHAGLNEHMLKASLTLVPQTGDKKESEFIDKKRVGFMDGGITDNQGLQSMMYADGRRIRKETDFAPFDLMMVNDVGSHFIHPYVMPQEDKKNGITLSTLNILVIACFAVALVIFILGLMNHCTAAIAAGSVLALLPLIFMLGVLYLKKQITGASQTANGLKKSLSESIVKLLVSYFTKTPLSVLKQMLAARAESVLMLNMSIFLKRIRQILYDTFYGSKQWSNRGKGNHIYDLSFSNNLNRKSENPPAYLEPSRDMQIVAENAFEMGTTLWFDQAEATHQHIEACIVACGQFTTCYNLIEYINKLEYAHSISKDAYNTAYQGRLDSLKKLLLADFERFKSDPFFLYNQSGIKYKINGFREIKMSGISFPENW